MLNVYRYESLKISAFPFYHDVLHHVMGTDGKTISLLAEIYKKRVKLRAFTIVHLIPFSITPFIREFLSIMHLESHPCAFVSYPLFYDFFYQSLLTRFRLSCQWIFYQQHWAQKGAKEINVNTYSIPTNIFLAVSIWARRRRGESIP